MKNFEYRDAFVHGDRLVLKQMINEFQPKFHSFLRKYGADYSECDEFFQVGLKVISENFILDPNKDVDNSHFFNYLATIGLNKWRTHCKKKNREISTLELEFPNAISEESIEKDMIRLEEHQAFMEKFKKISKDCQKILWAKIVEEKRYKEIASTMDTTEEFLRVKLNRCKKYLKKQWEE